VIPPPQSGKRRELNHFPVGAAFSIPAQGKVELFVVRIPTEPLSDEEQEKLAKGKRVPAEGHLFFKNAGAGDMGQILHRIKVQNPKP
jgi:hypothetical protein